MFAYAGFLLVSDLSLGRIASTTSEGKALQKIITRLKSQLKNNQVSGKRKQETLQQAENNSNKKQGKQTLFKTRVSKFGKCVFIFKL